MTQTSEEEFKQMVYLEIIPVITKEYLREGIRKELSEGMIAIDINSMVNQIMDKVKLPQ